MFNQPLQPFQETRARLFFAHELRPVARLRPNLDRDASGQLVHKRERHHAPKDQQTDRLEAHAEGERSIFHRGAGGAELLGGGVVRQGRDEAEGLDEICILEGTHQLRRGGVATLQTKLPHLLEAKDNPGDDRDRAHNLCNVRERLKVHLVRSMQRPGGARQDEVHGA